MTAHNLESQIKQLLTANHFLTAGQMVEWLAIHGQPFNKTSVYRALSRLLVDGQLCEHYFTSSQGLVYELREHHHDHVACERCGQVWELECNNEGGGEVPTSPLPKGFIASHHHVAWFGLCQQCQLIGEDGSKRPAAQ
jgi:Fur family ferric uptake transcriptional regulator